MDILRVRRARLTHRFRLSHDLYRPDADGRFGLSAAHPHRPARQEPEHHLDRGFHCGALRQEPGGGRDSRADRDHWHDPLHRAPAQSGIIFRCHHLGASRARRRGGAAVWRPRTLCRTGDGDFRRSVRHAAHRCDRTSRWPDVGDRHRVGGEAHRLLERWNFCDFCCLPWPLDPVEPGARPSAHRVGRNACAAIRLVLRDDCAVAVCDRAVAASIPCDGGREPHGIRNPPRRLAVSALSGADQSVRAADRDGRAADFPGRTCRQRYVRRGAAARCPFRIDHARRLHRRLVGGDRNGHRRDGGARHYGVERHRDAACAQAPREPLPRKQPMPARSS